ncbi:MAG: DUF4296 domain-containing protein [Bacteroidetes bacterium]|nr:DUF4296 domain-containing protein [Bacteroidota bacterium]
MKKLLQLAILGFCLASCQSHDDIPKEIIQPGEMEDIILEANLIEGALKANLILGDSAKKVAPSLYKEVYDSHHITDSAFQASVDWYFEHPEIMEEIQKQVIARLLEMEK